MIRFPFLERFGVTAIMSDIRDGDCCSRPDAESFLASCGFSSPESVSLVSQVHGLRLAEAASCSEAIEADGIVSDLPGAVLAIRVADCVPILLYDPVHGAGAIVHAGRAGTFQGIAGEAVVVMAARYQSDPAELIVVIGPSAGPCCYEVGEDIRLRFVKNGGVSEGTRLDLWTSNANQLLNMGVSSGNVEVSEICTICSGEFHSYRKSNTASRNLAVLGLERP